MDYMVKQTGSLNSVAEDLFVELFCDTFGPDKSQFLFVQYPVTDIYGNRRFIDFAFTAVSDARRFGKRTLFLAHTKELVLQAQKTFKKLWPEANTGIYLGDRKEKNAYVVCGSIQSVSQNIREFSPDDFGYVIIDECHHGTAGTYKKILGYFNPEFTLGLTATTVNMPYSLHRIFNIKEYQAGKYVISSQSQFELDKDLLAKGEKPSVYLDFPLDISDYELIDLFNWQDQAKDMISQLEFVRMVDVQAETIEKYIRDGKIKPDLEVPIGNTRKFKYFKVETVNKYAKEFGWDLINAANMKDKFMDMVKTMDMSYSYKPVLLKAMLEHADGNGKVRVEDIVSYFIDFYEERKKRGLVVEKPNSIYCKDNYTRKDVERNIFTNPFKRFEDMRFMKRCKEVEYVEFNKHVFKKLSKQEINWILGHCEVKLREYYSRL